MDKKKKVYSAMKEERSLGREHYLGLSFFQLLRISARAEVVERGATRFKTTKDILYSRMIVNGYRAGR